eukprot:Blabericola_migrator_1__311@NODE_107_length_14077_cov_92_419629_g95_i0_p9_GENE_NODE_107_length_14077_cov_92_419629_g95_i0NODE_107_length_14077_cov_92_419629_g95_i0_p9_ORF_typecomplete_len181_score21_70SHP/PF03579_13/1_4e03SHP/PF03579_13/11_NODE_107_length_14077_cov_92_419629_g95_i01326713809
MCCVPLALGTLLICAFFVAWGSFNIYDAVTAGGLNWDDLGNIVVGITKCLVGSVGFVSVLLKWARGVYVVIVGYNVFMVSAFVAMFLKWVEWAMAFNGHTLTSEGERWEPSVHDWIFMVLFTLLHSFLYIMSLLLIIGILRSTRMVILAGGTGWELLNHHEVRDHKMIKLFVDDELSSRV